ncbi:hypothetical protein G9A89_015803 [Geosiphon pyriformis]|nr:hypothetical protein G9A89_015803 [Geosiphon pyriformis]
MCVCYNCVSDSELPIQSRAISKHLSVYDAAINLSANNILITNLLAAATNNLSTTATSHLSAAASSNLSTPTIHQANKQDFISGIWVLNYLSLLITLEDVISNNPELDQQPTILTNNISPAIVINDEFLAAIFPFKLEEVMSVSLFSKAALEEKPITAMYTDAKVNGHSIKLILDSGLAGSIIT